MIANDNKKISNATKTTKRLLKSTKLNESPLDSHLMTKNDNKKISNAIKTILKTLEIYQYKFKSC